MRLLHASARAARTLMVALGFAPPAWSQSLQHARQLFDSSKYEAAKSEFTQLQKQNERNPVPPYYLGRIAMIQNQGGEAIDQLERAVDLEPGNALYHSWLGDAIRDEIMLVSKIKQPFMARRIMKEWRRAIELDPRLNETRLSLVMFYTYAPGFMGGGLDNARAQADELTRRSPFYGAIAHGMVAEGEKNEGAEQAAYEQAIQIAPDSLAGYIDLAETYARLHKSSEAVATLDRYLARHPTDAHALFQFGRIAGIVGLEPDRAEAALKQFLNSPPPDVHVADLSRAHYSLGKIAEKRGLKDVAREHYSTALKINPRNPAARRAIDALK